MFADSFSELDVLLVLSEAATANSATHVQMHSPQDISDLQFACSNVLGLYKPTGHAVLERGLR